MASIDRGIDFSSWSDDLRDMIRRRISESGGVALMTLSALIAVALATWSVQDPSLSHAIDGPGRNFLGTPGAIGADLLMQLFGLAATVFVLPVAVWGWRIATHRPFDREWMRLAFWLVGSVFAAGLASCLPASPHWPLPSGLGGVIGDAMLRLPEMMLGSLGGIQMMIVASIFGPCTLAAVVIATGFGYHDPSDVKLDERWAKEAAGPEDNEEERTSISLGWLVHGLLSLKARIVRLVTRRSALHAPKPIRRAPTPAVSERDRFEPRVRAVDEPDLEEDEEIEIEAAPRARKPAVRKPARRSGGFQLPELSLLALPKSTDKFAPSPDSIQETATSLESVLGDFGVRGQIINARPGPVVTLYELEPAPGIKSSRVIGLADDIARSMSALSARVAVVSGRNAIGIELPNDKREKVYFREMLSVKDESHAKLPLC